MTLYASQDDKKRAAAEAAIQHLPKGGILGVGTGSTVNFLIDLLPELQGRLPIRVELNALSKEDMKNILTEPQSSLTKQYIGLMKAN